MDLAPFLIRLEVPIVRKDDKEARTAIGFSFPFSTVPTAEEVKQKIEEWASDHKPHYMSDSRFATPDEARSYFRLPKPE